MLSTKRKASPSFAEFIILVSMMMSLTALSIDAMLPALSQIGSDLNVQNANDRQLVISMIFLGLWVASCRGWVFLLHEQSRWLWYAINTKAGRWHG